MRQAAAVHDGHLLANDFALPFIEDIPNNTLAFVRVYDCAGQGHLHAGIISAAVIAWNNTGRVKFFYTPDSTTACDAIGFPTIKDGRVGITHDDVDSRTFFQGDQNPPDAFRNNDVGTEGDVGMWPYRTSRIHMRSEHHTTSVLVHELGHAAGLSDLYNHEEVAMGLPCAPAHTHDPDTTIMDCSVGPSPLQHDMDNLDDLYMKQPTRVSDFTAVTGLDGSLVTVGFGWTDKSFNELFQFIAMDTNMDGIGDVGYPVVVPRDQELALWEGLQPLQPNTPYCFFIQP